MSHPQKRKAPHPSQKSSQSLSTSQSRPDIKRGWEWYNSIGKPRFVLSPMVGQSELPYRQLLRSHGAQLTYTPMIIANEYIKDVKYRQSVFTWDEADRPLVVQLCATTPQDFLQAAKIIISTAKPDAIELNLGCPQSCAERGGYGSWMMDRMDVIRDILTQAVNTLPVPITAKIRVFPSLKQTHSYVDMLSSTGISLLTVHPRQRNHREEVLAQWDVIEGIRARVKVPVVLNGDIWGPMDLAMAMCLHQVDGYMCAQGALQMPAIFKTITQFVEYNRPQPQEQKDGGEGHNDEQDTQEQTTKKQNTNNTSSNSSQPIQLGKIQPKQDDNDALTFPSTKEGSFSNGKLINYYRLRKYLGTALNQQQTVDMAKVTTIINTKCDDELKTKDTNDNKATEGDKEYSFKNVNDKITTIFNLIPSSFQEKSLSTIQSYPLTAPQRTKFNSNKINREFITVILWLESNIDQVKRQLQNAVEYIRFVEKFPIHHHSVAQRHLFFILFDLLNKHIDCYDKLYVATNVTEFKEVVQTLFKKAMIGADFSGCAPDNYFAVHHKERGRRRDGTLAPPPWPVGGGGFNVAMNSAKNKKPQQQDPNAEGCNMTIAYGSNKGPGVQGKRAEVLEIAGKKINMSKFD